MEGLLSNFIVSAFSIFAIASASASANESPCRFTRGFPADAASIEKAHNATSLRRAIEAYKVFSPTVATEAVIQRFKPHGAVPNEFGIIMPQDPKQQFSVSKQDMPYIISVFDFGDATFW